MRIETEDYISFEELLKQVQHKYAENLPFVCYKPPHHTSVILLEQENDTLYFFTVGKEEQEGFVFAPFDANEPAVIITPNKFTISHLPTQSIVENTNIDILEDTKTEKQKHIDLVTKAINEIHQGTFEKVVLSRKITIKKVVNPFKSFTNMIIQYPSAFCYLFYHPKVGTWLAATPETLFHSNGEDFCTMALAGTQPFKEGEIHWHTKEKEEQQIVTDTIVQQLQKYVNGLEVSTPKTIRAGKVMHLCTEINGKIKKDKFFEVVQRLHPTPAVCGYPTNKAYKFIIENELYDRQYYTGYCGWVSNNDLAFYVNLRCMQITDNEAYLYVGGGITKDSIPEKEYEETQNKAMTMMTII